MKLPNSEQAILGNKLERYCLNSQHLQGRHKALLFERKLGITVDNKEVLEQAIMNHHQLLRYAAWNKWFLSLRLPSLLPASSILTWASCRGLRSEILGTIITLDASS